MWAVACTCGAPDKVENQSNTPLRRRKREGKRKRKKEKVKRIKREINKREFVWRGGRGCFMITELLLMQANEKRVHKRHWHDASLWITLMKIGRYANGEGVWNFLPFFPNDISRFGSARKTEGSRIGFCEAYERACNCAIPNDTTNGQEDGFSPVYEGY